MGETRMHTEFWWENQRARDRLGDQEVDVSKFIKLNLKSVGREWNGLIWLKIGTDGGLL
jgi:hypothetical protein